MAARHGLSPTSWSVWQYPSMPERRSVLPSPLPTCLFALTQKPTPERGVTLLRFLRLASLPPFPSPLLRTARVAPRLKLLSPPALVQGKPRPRSRSWRTRHMGAVARLCPQSSYRRLYGYPLDRLDVLW